MGTPSTVGTRLAAGLVIVLSCACGQQAASARPIDPADPADLAALRRLTPSDAAAVIVLPSVEATDTALADMSLIVGGRVPPILDAFLEASPGFPLSYVDRTRPVLVAIKAGPMLNMPAPTFVVPVNDPDAAAAALSGYTVHVDGNYIGFSTDSDYTLGEPSALTATFPTAPIAVRADLHALLTPLRPMAEAMLPGLAAQVPEGSVAPGFDIVELYSAYLSMLFDGAAATEIFELALDVRGDDLLFNGQIDVTEGSILANVPAASCDTLDDMVAWLDGDASMQMVMAMDARAFTDLTKRWMLDLQGVFPQADEDQWMEYLATMQMMTARCGHVFAGDGDFSPAGMNFNYLLEAEDADNLVPMMTRFMKEGLEVMGGYEVELTESTVDGRASTELAMSMEAMFEAADGSVDEQAQEMMRAVYGGDGIFRYRTTAGDGHILLSVGTGEGAPPQRADRPQGSPPAEILSALNALGDADTRIAMRLDYAPLLLQMAEIMASIPGGENMRPPSTDEPIPLTFWVGGKGTHWTYGSTLDLGGLIRGFQGMAPR